MIFPADSTRQLRDAVARGVMRLAPVQGIDTGIRDVPGGIEIGLTDRHADNIDPLCLHLLGPVGDRDRCRFDNASDLLRERSHFNRLTSLMADSTALFA